MTLQSNGRPFPYTGISYDNRLTTSMSNGSFYIQGVAPGSYTLTPTLPGYTFTPPSQVVSTGNVNGTLTGTKIDQSAGRSGSLPALNEAVA